MTDLYARGSAAARRRDRQKAKSEGLWLYLGGKMNGVQDFGFLAFDAGRDLLTAHPEVGEVFSPADNDRVNFGFEGIGKDGHPSGAAGQRRRMLTQDMAWIGRWSDGMVVLDGWEDSPGTRAEAGFHQGLFLPVWRLGDFLAAGAAADPIPLLGSVPAAGEVPGAGGVRKFSTGADRDTDEGKLDFEGYLSPLALVRYAEYMRGHQQRNDGTWRPGDNWQAGIPRASYMKSMARHYMDAWLAHRGHGTVTGADLQSALCAIMFNAMGYLDVILKEEAAARRG